MSKAYFHSLENFGTVDGPGIRLVVFLAGCSLGCSFCHNPDTWARGNKQISVDEILAKYEEYRPFYENSGGGITISGGEPLQQPEFLIELFKACRTANIHTVLDTSGDCPRAKLEKVLPYVDQVLFCIKVVDPVKHRHLTSKTNKHILENLSLVSALVPLVLRYVVIPSINDTEADLQALKDLIHSLPHKPTIDLLAYHTLALKKWQELNLTYPLQGIPEASKVDVERVATYLAN